MRLSSSRTLILGLSALALMTAPVLLNGSLQPLDISAYADPGNGNGNGGGNGGGGGSDNGGGNSDHGGGNGGGNSDHSNNGGGNGNGNGGGQSASPGERGNGNGNGKSKAAAAAAVAGDGEETGRGNGKGNLRSELAGLNSLNRNINGLMNSSDPRMDGIREFIIASAELEGAAAALDEANEALAAAEEDYLAVLQSVSIDPSLDVTPETISDRIDEINDLLDDETPPDNADELAAERDILEDALGPVTAAFADLEAAQTAADDAADAVADLEGATDEAALQEALEEAANRNRDVTDEVVEWASDRLGVGDADGLIDDFVARQ